MRFAMPAALVTSPSSAVANATTSCTRARSRSCGESGIAHAASKPRSSNSTRKGATSGAAVGSEADFATWSESRRSSGSAAPHVAPNPMDSESTTSESGMEVFMGEYQERFTDPKTHADVCVGLRKGLVAKGIRHQAASCNSNVRMHANRSLVAGFSCRNPTTRGARRGQRRRSCRCRRRRHRRYPTTREASRDRYRRQSRRR